MPAEAKTGAAGAADVQPAARGEANNEERRPGQDLTSSGAALPHHIQSGCSWQYCVGPGASLLRVLCDAAVKMVLLRLVIGMCAVGPWLTGFRPSQALDLPYSQVGFLLHFVFELVSDCGFALQL